MRRLEPLALPELVEIYDAVRAGGATRADLDLALSRSAQGELEVVNRLLDLDGSRKESSEWS